MKTFVDTKVKNKTIIVTKTYNHTFTDKQIEFLKELNDYPNLYYTLSREDELNDNKVHLVELFETLGILEYLTEDILGKHFDIHSELLINIGGIND